MAVAEIPSSFHIHPPSSSSSSSSSSSASPACPSPLLPPALSRCCASFARLSPCLFVASLLFFFLMLQFDVVPPMDSPPIRDLLQKLRRLPFPSTHASPSPSSPSFLPSRSSSSPSAEPGNTSPTQPSSAPSPRPSPPQDSDSSDPSTTSSASAGPGSSIPMSRVAICIVGGAREFEVTGPSLKEYLLRSFANADVFLHAPLDKDSYKLSILSDTPNLVRFRIFTPEPISELRTYTDVLTASNSPHGVQGLLQYFNLVEGCARMIQEYQQQHGFEYKWVIRTRLDGYWNGYLVPLEEMDEKAYTVPVGSQFGGLNDRLGIGNWQTSEVALSRLSLLPLIHAHGGRGLNSETSFKKQLEVKKVAYKLHDFPFCVLSRRKYGWPPGHRGVPVASMFSKGHLNGAKCRPCEPVSSGAAASSIVQGLDRGWSWPGDGEGIELCNPTGEWDPRWPDVYDAMAGPERASVRVMLSHQNHTECIQANEVLKRQVQFWDAPAPEMICKKGLRL